MDVLAQAPTVTGRLPAQRVDPSGCLRIDHRAVFALALPLILSGGVQVVLSLTDTWFIGHISAAALAAVAAVQGFIGMLIAILGCAAIVVQTIVAQACGARCYRRASLATWTGLWATLCITPLFLIIGSCGRQILTHAGLRPPIDSLASQFWLPRVCGGPLATALWVMTGLFTGIGQPRMTALISAATVALNIVFNELFIVTLSLGVGGSAMATNVALACGLVLALSVFLSDTHDRAYRSRTTYKPNTRRILSQLRYGFPMALLLAGDMLGYSLFQLMQVRLSTSDGVATQLVLMLATISYVPGASIASAGTTLVGTAVGAGDREWAMRVGTRVIVLTLVCMGGIGLSLALGGAWILPLFVTANTRDAVEILSLGACLLWIAAGYQVFSALVLGSGSCLRGAGDAAVPAALVLPLSLLVFVPLAHSFTFAPGQGFIHWLPQFGWGAIGGFVAVLIYQVLMGTALFLRWRAGIWQKIQI